MLYPLFMKKTYADIGIAPLEQNEFNRSKSDLKMLEYTVCGIPAVYTNIEPYKHATMKADDEKQMIDMIEDLASNHDKRKEVWEKDKNFVKDRLFIEENRKKMINEHL